MKKGFTLVELLIVIAVLAVLATIVLPNVIDSYNQSMIKKMIVEEGNVNDAGEVYLEEHCRNPLKYINPDSEKKEEVDYKCPTSYNKTSKEGYICLSELQDPSVENGNQETDSYIGEIEFKNDTCKGFMYVVNTNYKTYLFCGEKSEKDDTYPYATDTTFPADVGLKAQIYEECGITVEEE